MKEYILIRTDQSIHKKQVETLTRQAVRAASHPNNTRQTQSTLVLTGATQ